MNTAIQPNASGVLKHHFWGNYSAEIFLKFDSKEVRDAALEKLQLESFGEYRDVLGNVRKSEGWRTLESNPDVAAIHLAGEQLDQIVLLLEAMGAEKKKITSIATSIDRGELFRFEVK